MVTRILAFRPATVVARLDRRSGACPISTRELLGPAGARVLTRLTAFLLLCIGVQIMLTGVQDALAPLLAPPS